MAKVEYKNAIRIQALILNWNALIRIWKQSKARPMKHDLDFIQTLRSYFQLTLIFAKLYEKYKK